MPNQKKRLLSVLMILVLIIAVYPVKSSATQQVYTVSVTPVQQFQSNWCWAACAEMAGKSKYPSSSRGQLQVVNHLFGTYDNPYPNVEGSLQNSATGSTYVTYNNYSYSYTYSTWTFSQIATSIQQGNAVQTALGYYTSAGRNGGHMILIYEIHLSYNMVSFIDPGDGLSHTCGFSSLQNGSYNGGFYDQTVYL